MSDHTLLQSLCVNDSTYNLIFGIFLTMLKNMQLPVVSPTDVYKRLKTGEHAIFLDVRSEEMFNCYRLYNAVNQPASSFATTQISDVCHCQTFVACPSVYNLLPH